MDKYLKETLAAYSQAELTQVCMGLNKSYNIYDPDSLRWEKISYALFKTSKDDIKNLQKHLLSNKVVNDLIFSYYICERVVKYYFIRSLKSKANNIVAFEMSIGDSRIDVCRINGSSYAYEIKTEYDTFDRLKSQMQDYSKSFEKVYVIVPASRINDVTSHIPASCGIISYRAIKDGSLVFSYTRGAQKNLCDPNFCLNNLSSNEMSILLRMLKLKDCHTRNEKLAALTNYAQTKSIWTSYRALLKSKYYSQWKFLEEHFEEILPIDVQTFFSANLDPSLFYSK